MKRIFSLFISLILLLCISVDCFAETLPTTSLHDYIFNMWLDDNLIWYDMYFSEHSTFTRESIDPYPEDSCWIIFVPEEKMVRLCGKKSNGNWVATVWNDFTFDEMLSLCMAMCKTWETYEKIGIFGIMFWESDESQNRYITNISQAEDYLEFFKKMYNIDEEVSDGEPKEFQDESLLTDTPSLIQEQISPTDIPIDKTSNVYSFRDDLDGIDVAAKSVFYVEVLNKDKESIGRASGFVAFDEHLFVTNQHVIQDAAYLQIEGEDDSKYLLDTVIVSDEIHDIAILWFPDGTKYRSLEMNADEELKRGQPIVTIGNPIGYRGTVTYGNISAFPIMEGFGNLKCIQFTAPTSQGSSGGCLFDDYGKLIGVTSAVGVSEYSGEVGNDVGLAVPIKIVQDLYAQWDKNSYETLGTKRSWNTVGVTPTPVPTAEPDNAEILPIGAYINQYGIINHYVNFRSGPYVNTPVAGDPVKAGVYVYLVMNEVNSKDEIWTKVIVNGKEGYIKSEYISVISKRESDVYNSQQRTPAPVCTATPVPTAEPENAESLPAEVFINQYGIINHYVNFRSGPDAHTPVAGDPLQAGEYVYIIINEINVNGEIWTKVNVNGKEGYIKSEYIYVISRDDSIIYLKSQPTFAPVYTATPAPTQTPTPTVLSKLDKSIVNEPENVQLIYSIIRGKSDDNKLGFESKYDETQYKGETITGERISRIISSSVASAVGLTIGDTIIAVDNKKIYSEFVLARLLAKKAVSDDVYLTVFRNGRESSVVIRMPDIVRAQSKEKSDNPTDRVSEPTPELMSEITQESTPEPIPKPTEVPYMLPENANRSIAITNDNLTVSVGKQLTLKAQITKLSDDAPVKTVLVWESTDNNIAKVNAQGIVTGIAPGYTFIMCSAKDNPDIKAYAILKVVQPIKSLKLAETTISLLVGGTEEAARGKISVQINPENASDKRLSFISSDESVVRVNSDGGLQALRAGKAKITVSCLEDGSKVNAICNITVSQAVESIKLDSKKIKLGKGEKNTLKASVLPENATQKKLVWESSDPNVAIVSISGIVTAKSTGKCQIVCSTTDGSNVEVSCEVVVIEKVKKITTSLSKNTLNLIKGKTKKIAITYSPDTASEKDITWLSSNSTIASVKKTDSKHCEITAIKSGSCDIVGTANDGSKVKVTIKVNVEDEFSVKDTGSGYSGTSWGTKWFQNGYKNTSKTRTIDGLTIRYYCTDVYGNKLKAYGFGSIEQEETFNVKIGPGSSKTMPKVYAYGYDGAKYIYVAVVKVHYTDGTTATITVPDYWYWTY